VNQVWNAGGIQCARAHHDHRGGDVGRGRLRARPLACVTKADAPRTSVAEPARQADGDLAYGFRTQPVY
jgi:hypothetical protein